MSKDKYPSILLHQIYSVCFICFMLLSNHSKVNKKVTQINCLFVLSIFQPNSGQGAFRQNLSLLTPTFSHFSKSQYVFCFVTVCMHFI